MNYKMADEKPNNCQTQTDKNERKTNLEKLIKEGIGAREIAKIMNISRGGAYQILEKYQLKQLYNEAQAEKQLKIKADEEKEEKEKEEKNKTKKNLLRLLSQRALYLAEQESWGEEKAIEYLLCTKGEITYYPPEKRYKKHYSFFELEIIFNRYHKAQRKGIKLSLRELTEGFNIKGLGNISMVLKKLGLEPMYGARERIPNISKEKIEAIKRAYSTDLTFVDIGYFLSIPFYVCKQRSKKPRSYKKPIKIWSKRIEKRAPHTEASLSYSLISQIYESQDLGFTKEETAFLLDTKDFVVSYTLEHRNEIEPKLIGQLRILYNNKEHNKPYKEWTKN